ncbi:DUF3742 family protein [Pseudomonas synxantha]|uniref:DUF3742 family protein n=1 Tax=Pseudomonas synxantha TaxID=47883 RepID=UPI00286CF7FC|nr:DUF3742 family protein [Pseudomonas synxantha]
MEREQPTRAARFGQWGGRQWRRYVRREEEGIHWLKGKGLPDYVTGTLAWATRLSLFLMILLPVISLAAIVAIAYVSAKCLGNSTREADGAADGEQNDHKKSVFYDPINYNDPDDPRFDD